LIIPRPFQNEARYQCNTLLNGGRNPLFVSGTGTGKTKTGVVIIGDRIKLKKKTLMLTPQVEIFNQWVKDISEEGLHYGLIHNGRVHGKNRDVYIGMAQSVWSMLDYLPERTVFDEVWSDEAHHSGAKTWEDIFTHFESAQRAGLTASPYRPSDNKPLGAYYTDIVQTIQTQEAVDKGFLCEPLVIVPEKYREAVPLYDGSGKYDPQKKADLLGETEIIGDMIEQYGEIFGGLPVLVACSTYEQAAGVSELFNKAGWCFDHIHSNLHPNDRARLIKEVKGEGKRRLNGLCTVGIGIEGMDIPGLYGLIWMRRTLSLTIYIQLCGRVLRPLPGKKYGIILDPCGNTFIHGRPEIERQWNLHTEYQPPDRDAISQQICPRCGVANSLDNDRCHICGLEFISDEAEAIKAKQKRGFPAMVDGNLIVLDEAQRARYAEEVKAAMLKQREQIKAAQTGAGDGGKSAEPVESAEIARKDKLEILRKGLTGKGAKSLFKETLEEFI